MPCVDGYETWSVSLISFGDIWHIRLRGALSMSKVKHMQSRYAGIAFIYRLRSYWLCVHAVFLPRKQELARYEIGILVGKRENVDGGAVSQAFSI